MKLKAQLTEYIHRGRMLRYITAALMTISILIAHDRDNRAIEFPNIPEYLTLKCDLHMHTVFSDGSVWPDIRVEEAVRDGLDAIATTEHLEYQPWRNDIPHPDRNRSHQLASYFSRDENLMVINGSEITRSMPPGHANAIFIEDANRLILDDPLDVFQEARRQGAFIFWNHPHWISQSPDALVPLSNIHKELIRDGLLEGIEVVNDTTYSDEALQIALDHNLTILGTSDIHGIVDWQYKIPDSGHRPVTLVFSRERTARSIKQGLKNRRTVVWFNNLLIGREEYILPLINECLDITAVRYRKGSSVVSVTISNHSDAEFVMRNLSQFNFYADADLVTIPPHGEKILEVKTLRSPSKFELRFSVLNAITAPGIHPEITLLVNRR